MVRYESSAPSDIPLALCIVLTECPCIADSLPEVWEVLARHGALEAGHQLARKSARSPSRRLRFGRRSDPMMPVQPVTLLYFIL